MAVSFITQTIETIKSQPCPPPPPAVAPTKLTTTSNSNVRREELAAKHKRLEEHISESKALMAKLSQARSKEEKDGIMKIIREKSRWVYSSTLSFFFSRPIRSSFLHFPLLGLFFLFFFSSLLCDALGSRWLSNLEIFPSPVIPVFFLGYLKKDRRQLQ